jgi:hypothetical protein
MANEDIDLLNLAVAKKALEEAKNSPKKLKEQIDKISDQELIAIYAAIRKHKDVILGYLGADTHSELSNLVCNRMQIEAYEEIEALQFLTGGEEGSGVYVKPAPFGAFGFEIGAVAKKSENEKIVTTKAAFGIYMRSASVTRPIVNQEARDRAGADIEEALGL